MRIKDCDESIRNSAEGKTFIYEETNTVLVDQKKTAKQRVTGFMGNGVFVIVHTVRVELKLF